MKIVVFIVGFAVLAAVGGFTFVALQDVPVAQTEMVKTVPHDKFYSEKTQ